MGLLDNPPTRPRTYVEGEPVDPNDMNEIFDACIALLGYFDLTDDSVQVSQLYETEEFDHGHHGCAFRATTGDANSSFNGVAWAFTGATDLYSPLEYLRPGDKITHINWIYDRHGAGTVTVALRRRPLIGVPADVQSDADATGAEVAFAEHDIMYDHTVEAGYSYFLKVSVTDAANQFASAQVYVTRPRP